MVWLAPGFLAPPAVAIALTASAIWAMAGVGALIVGAAFSAGAGPSDGTPAARPEPLARL
jgi:hypothetical protein